MIAPRRGLTVSMLTVALLWAAPAVAQDPPANDLLNAVLWMQRSVEYKATALGAVRAGAASASTRRWPIRAGRPRRRSRRAPTSRCRRP